MNLNDIARPYDIKIKYKGNIERLKSTIIPELRTIQADYSRILVIMGKNYRRVIEPLFDNEKYIALIDPRGIGWYKNIITNLLKVPTIRVWDEILIIKNRLEKNAQKISVNKVSRDKMTIKISSE